MNPLFAFSFLESFVDILRDYLGDVTEMTIKDNFDIVYMASIVWQPLNDCSNSLVVANRRDPWWGTSHDDRDGDVEGDSSSSKLGSKDIRRSWCFGVRIFQSVVREAIALKCSFYLVVCSLLRRRHLQHRYLGDGRGYDITVTKFTLISRNP